MYVGEIELLLDGRSLPFYENIAINNTDERAPSVERDDVGCRQTALRIYRRGDISGFCTKNRDIQAETETRYVGSAVVVDSSSSIDDLLGQNRTGCFWTGRRVKYL